jgi:hypothetical protein
VLKLVRSGEGRVCGVTTFATTRCSCNSCHYNVCSCNSVEIESDEIGEGQLSASDGCVVFSLIISGEYARQVGLFAVFSFLLSLPTQSTSIFRTTMMIATSQIHRLLENNKMSDLFLHPTPKKYSRTLEQSMQYVDLARRFPMSNSLLNLVLIHPRKSCSKFPRK